MTVLNLSKKFSLRLFLAGSFLAMALPTGSAFASSAPCLAQFADSAWLQGEPQEVSGLINRNNLVLTQVQVVPSSNFDFGGVIPVNVFQGYSVIFGSSLSSSPKVLFQGGPISVSNWWMPVNNYLTHTYEYRPIVYKSEIKPFQYFDVRVGAVARKAPITVSFLYQGADCTDRTVSVSSYIDIVPIQTLNISTATDDQITDFLKRNNDLSSVDFLGIRKQLSRVRNIGAWFKYTKKEPIPIIFPKGVPAKSFFGLTTTKHVWDAHPGVSSLLWLQQYSEFAKFDYVDSTDGCLTNKNKDKYIKVIDSEQPYFASKVNACRVFLHISSTDFSDFDNVVFAPEQLVVEGWITKAVIPAKSQQYLPSIFCSNGTVFRAVIAKKPKCPTGLTIVSD